MDCLVSDERYNQPGGVGSPVKKATPSPDAALGWSLSRPWFRARVTVPASIGIAGVALENSQFAERIRQEALVRSNFERYFAPPVAERIAKQAGPASPGGERRTVAMVA